MILCVSIQRSRRVIPTRPDRWEGTAMAILSALRNSSARDGSGQSESAAAGAPAEARLPFPGYDRLDDRDVIERLSGHSQIELEAVESYERSNQNRVTVLDKLRWLRGSEPLPGYDALSTKEVLTALKEADLTTIKKVRGYERKFANRRDVLEEVIRVHHARRAAQPASAPPGYQPMSATDV
jgi:hypothetical protein